jgi:hypothetical protein
VGNQVSLQSWRVGLQPNRPESQVIKVSDEGLVFPRRASLLIQQTSSKPLLEVKSPADEQGLTFGSFEQIDAWHSRILFNIERTEFDFFVEIEVRELLFPGSFGSFPQHQGRPTVLQ